jgi:hypothetical protein
MNLLDETDQAASRSVFNPVQASDARDYEYRMDAASDEA